LSEIKNFFYLFTGDNLSFFGLNLVNVYFGDKIFSLSDLFTIFFVSEQLIQNIETTETLVFCLKEFYPKFKIGNQDDLKNLKIGKVNFSICSLILFEDNHFFTVVKNGESWLKIDDEFTTAIEPEIIFDYFIYMVFAIKIVVKFYHFLNRIFLKTILFF
jgi:hypothetical protein